VPVEVFPEHQIEKNNYTPPEDISHREMDPEIVSLDRQVRLPEVRHAFYLSPVHVILTGAPMEIADCFVTAICWLVAKRPSSIQERVVTLTLEQRESLVTAQGAPHSDQIIVFLGMAGLMTLAKEVRATGNNANHEYLAKRWQALCATIGIEDIIATRTVSQETYMTFMRRLETWQGWMKPRGDLKRRLLDIALMPLQEGTQDIVKGAIDQVKMVLQDFGIKSILLMNAFVASQNRAILLAAVAQQAVTLRRTLRELREQHGEKFPYIGIYPLQGADRLNHRSYPDLYYAAVTTAIGNKDLGSEGRYVVTDVQTQTSKHIIDEYARKDLKMELFLDDTAKANLRELGITLSIRRPRERDDDVYIEPPRAKRRAE